MNDLTIITRKGVMKDGKIVVDCSEFVNIEPAIVDGEDSNEILIGTYPNGENTYLKITENGSFMKMSNNFSINTGFKNGVSVVGIYDERFGYKYGLVNDKLSLKLQFEYDSIVEIANHLYKIEKRGAQGVYDINKEKIIIEPEFAYITYNEENNLLSLIY